MVAHSVSFALLKNKKDFVISIAIPQGEDFPLILQAKSSEKTFHTGHPIQSETNILFDKKSKSVFIPAELGIEIE